MAFATQQPTTNAPVLLKPARLRRLERVLVRCVRLPAVVPRDLRQLEVSRVLPAKKPRDALDEERRVLAAKVAARRGAVAGDHRPAAADNDGRLKVQLALRDEGVALRVGEEAVDGVDARVRAQAL